MTASQNSQTATTSLFQSATQWLQLLQERRIGALELLDLHLDQLDRHHDRVNAVVARDIDNARAAARAADNTPQAQRLQLHGLPMTVKDSLEAVGMPTTCGLPFLADHRPERDADAVARLKSAGAIIFGKTNLPPGAMDWQSNNPVYGETTNPWDAGRTPGGSSGGSAAAVAAGFVPLELGSDIGGSVRVPAHFCGVYGHKPSYGIVPSGGHIPPMPGSLIAPEMGVLGPLARSAHDLELAMDVLVAPRELQQTAWHIVIPPSRHERLQDFRVALWADDNTFAVDGECLSAIESWADDLRRLGVSVDARARPDIDWHACYETYLTTLFQVIGMGRPSDVIQSVIDAQATRPADDPGYPVRVARALKLRHFEYFQVMEQREALFRRWREFFNRFDLLICPVMPTVAYPLDRRGNELPDPIAASELRRMNVNGLPRSYMDGLQWPSIASVANLPATAIPTGRRIDGLPMGVQMIGPYLEDRTPIRFAQLLEQALGGCAPTPGFF